MDYIICSSCGAHIDPTDRVCPQCSALNFKNADVLKDFAKQNETSEKELRKFSNTFLIISLLLGIVLFIADIIILVQQSEYYLLAPAFVSTIAAGMMAIFSIIGLVKGESVGKGVFISGAISIGILATYGILLF